MTQYIMFNTVAGTMGAAVADGALTHVWVAGQKYAPDTETWTADNDSRLLLRVQEQVHAYLAGELRQFDLSMRPSGTVFQQSVWHALRDVPYGATRTYAELATTLGNPDAARAVGTAVGHNPLLLLVPCHRIVGKDGSLTGFAAGLDMKQRLLRLEAGSAVEWPQVKAVRDAV